MYDLTQHDFFGDLYIPEEFEAPGPQVLTDLQGRTNDVEAKQVVVLNSKVIKLQSFTYDGRGGEVYFWVGVGPQPSSKGHKV